MAWTAPITWSNAVLTAAQMNAQIKDNMLETAPAKAALAGQIFVATGPNAIAARRAARNTVVTAETTTSTSYVNLATVGPTVTLTSGTMAIICISCKLTNSLNAGNSFMSVSINGGSAVDDTALAHSPSTAGNFIQASMVYLETTLTAGSNDFQAKYHVNTGTGTFDNRRLSVLPF